jgi:predicted HTH domain antitoxin
MALQDIAAWLVAAYELSASGDLTFSEACRIAHVTPRTAYRMLREQGVKLWSAEESRAT